MNNSEKLLTIQRQVIIFLLSFLAIFAVFQVGLYFADLLRILGISLLLSYAFINVVDFLERFLHNRALSIVLVYSVLFALASICILLVVPAMVYQISQLFESLFNGLPETIRAMTDALAPLEARFRARQIDVKAVDILTNLAASVPKLEPALLITRVTDMAMSTMTWVLYAISIFVVTFYFLLEGHHMKEAILSLFPERHYLTLSAIAADIDKSLQAFFKGQIVLAILAGLVMLFVYMSLGVQYALVLSAFLAVSEILPVIGPPIGFLPAIISVAIHGMHLPGNRLAQIVFLTLIFTILQQLKDNVVAPRYIGNVIGLHPILIFVAIMIGAKLDGMLGIVFALPAACVLNVVVRHIANTKKETEAVGIRLQDES